MAGPVSALVSTVVFAFDAVGAEAPGDMARQAFDALVGAAQGLGFVTQDPGGINLTLTLAPEAAVADSVSRIAAAAVEFDKLAAPVRVRGLGHYGVVFRAESAGQVSFSGSAIRATQSALRRAPGSGGLIATREFADYAGKLADLPCRFEAIKDAAGAEGLSRLLFGAAGGQGAGGGGFSISDEAFVAFLKRRLATEIGPFAGALVDRALRTPGDATQLVRMLGLEIENPVARSAFEQEVHRFIKSRSTGA